MRSKDAAPSFSPTWQMPGPPRDPARERQRETRQRWGRHARAESKSAPATGLRKNREFSFPDQVQPFEEEWRNDDALTARAPQPVMHQNQWRRRAMIDRRTLADKRQRNYQQVDFSQRQSVMEGVNEFNGAAHERSGGTKVFLARIDDGQSGAGQKLLQNQSSAREHSTAHDSRVANAFQRGQQRANGALMLPDHESLERG